MILEWRDVMRACWRFVSMGRSAKYARLAEQCAELHIENAALKADNLWLTQTNERLARALVFERTRSCKDRASPYRG